MTKVEIDEQDANLQDTLTMLVERLKDPSLVQAALETLRNEIRTSTTSMTSVPKPLKYLRQHEAQLLECYERTGNKLLADILSVLHMTLPSERKTLEFRLRGCQEKPGDWGHEYVKHLAMEIIEENLARLVEGRDCSDIKRLSLELVPFFLSHNAEADACDLLMETEQLESIIGLVDKSNYSRISLYLASCVSFEAFPQNKKTLEIIFQLHEKFSNWSQMMITALKLDDSNLVKLVLEQCTDPLVKEQLVHVLAKQRFFIDILDDKLVEVISNANLHSHFLQVGEDLGVKDPKTPQDIFKSHLENTSDTAPIDSAKENLSTTFVNGFANCAFNTDKLMTNADSNWIFKNKDVGMTSAAASLGLLMLWNIDAGLTEVDKYLNSPDDNIKAGALLAIGIMNSGVRDESEPALALLSEGMLTQSASIKKSCIMGLGLAYAGTAKEEIGELLLPIVSDTTLSVELAGYAALALGQVFCGTMDSDIACTFLQILMERESDLNNLSGQQIALGLGFLYMGKQEMCLTTLEALAVISSEIGTQATILLQVCAFAGSGNVLKIQEMLSLVEKDGLAVLGIALCAMGEEIGSQMAPRMLSHIMYYGDAYAKRCVPLAIGLLFASNPQTHILDTLSRYSHDNDAAVALSAILALGLVGSGTNHAKLALMLRQLAGYWQKEPNLLFTVRIAQGLVHLGKGTLTLSPFSFERSLMSKVSLCGLLSAVLSFTNPKTSMVLDEHYLFYHLVLAIQPRFLVTLCDGKPVPVQVRVGQAVDVIGQAGRPKTITGFQTHSTPVVLQYNERAELATNEYLFDGVLEGIVLVKKNPDYDETVLHP